MTQTPAGSATDDSRDIRRTIAGQIRVARNERGLSQEALGDLIGVSRYVINRLEGQNQDVSLEQAGKLADVLDLPEITKLATRALSEPASQVEQPTTRDACLEALLSAPGLDRLEIVVADELDILSMLEKARLNLPPTVNIVFPTRARQEQLRGPAVPKVRAWAVQNQITRIFEALAVGGRLRPTAATLGFKLNLYESDDIRQSFVLVGSAEGTHCAVWPTMPNVQPDFDAIPISVSRDASFIQLVQDHFNELRSEKQPLTHLKAVVVVDRAAGWTASHPIARHRLSSYFQLGADSELEVAESPGQFGFGVALVLIHGYAERAGRPLRRRIRLPRDPKSKTFQLFSTHISDEDVTAIGEHGARSTLTSHAAQRKFIAGNPDAVICLDAFIQAARHGLLDEYGADIPASALQEIPLPEPLWIVEKTNDQGNRLMSVVPRLFHLDLTLYDNQVDASNARTEGTDEMGNSTKLSNWQASVGILEAALQESAGGTALGQQDLLSSTGPRLNDFLETARTVTKQWFFSVLNDLKIEE